MKRHALAWACGLAFRTMMLGRLCLQVVPLAPGSAFSIIAAAASLRENHDIVQKWCQWLRYPSKAEQLQSLTVLATGF
jgi:hypothetical protein